MVFAATLVHLFQFCFVVEITWVVVVFGVGRTFFDTCAAFDTDTGNLGDVTAIDGSHRADGSADATG